MLKTDIKISNIGIGHLKDKNCKTEDMMKVRLVI